MTPKQIVESNRLKVQTSIQNRIKELETDNTDHYLVYELLGIPKEECPLIDLYQNKARIIYKYAGTIIEDAARQCLGGQKIKIPNTISISPKTFEVDCFNEPYAIELKWRDATTDGDHIKKEEHRVKCISNAGMIPVRLMFYEPHRDNAKKIQKKLKELYLSLGGEYYSGIDAWNYIKDKTGIDLIQQLKDIINDQ